MSDRKFMPETATASVIPAPLVRIARERDQAGTQFTGQLGIRCAWGARKPRLGAYVVCQRQQVETCMGSRLVPRTRLRLCTARE